MSNEEQIAYWNGDAGQKWAERDAAMARILAPVADALMDHARVEGATAALDVGCGGGSNSFMLADRLGSSASVLGVDISAPMLAVAEAQRQLLGYNNVTFLEADAATHDFGDQRFDLLFSRFGVMFFDAPTEAFTHMRKAMASEGRLAFACWQALAANPWTALPLKAALTVLPAPEPTPPGTPGPFAFADADYVRQILSDAGWENIAIDAHPVSMRWPGVGDYASTVRDLVNTGPVGRLLADAAQEAREAVYQAAASALEPYYADEELALPGAVWLVTADCQS